MMRSSFFYIFLLLPFWALAETDSTPKETKPTTINSDVLRLDFNQHTGVFTGNVVVTGADFELKTTELTIYMSGPQNKIERMVARGKVTITQPDRNASSDEAEYTVATDRMLLTGSPVVTQKRNRVIGNSIALYLNSNRMEVDGRSKVILYDDLTSQPK